MSVEREIKERIAKKFNCKEFIYLGNTVLIVELSSKEKMVEFTDICDKQYHTEFYMEQTGQLILKKLHLMSRI